MTREAPFPRRGPGGPWAAAAGAAGAAAGLFFGMNGAIFGAVALLWGCALWLNDCLIAAINARLSAGREERARLYAGCLAGVAACFLLQLAYASAALSLLAGAAAWRTVLVAALPGTIASALLPWTMPWVLAGFARGLPDGRALAARTLRLWPACAAASVTGLLPPALAASSMLPALKACAALGAAALAAIPLGFGAGRLLAALSRPR